MIPAEVEEALQSLAYAIENDGSLLESLNDFWRTASRHRPGVRVISVELPEAAGSLGRSLPEWTRNNDSSEPLRAALEDARGRVMLTWCAASVDRTDVRMAPVLKAALAVPALRDEAITVARRRLVQGPFHDALACAPIIGSGELFAQPQFAEERARLEILLWEAGASAVQMPELGAWVWGSDASFDALVAEPARGSLRGRVLAARCMELSVRGMPHEMNPSILGRTLQVLQPLLLHPEPLVSTHAARALGLLAGTVEHLEGMLLDWLGGQSLVLRQRAMTAFASLPAARLRALGHELTAVIRQEEAASWALPAAAAGTPYLFQQGREIWEDLATRIMSGAGGLPAARELARGLATLWRAGARHEDVERPLRELRELARGARPEAIQDWRDVIAILAATDPVDGAERDPLDLEIGLENLVHLAAQYDDEEADARASRFARSLRWTFREARSIAQGDGSPRRKAAGMNHLEGCARSMALRLWGPQLATHPRGERVPEPDLTETWEAMAEAPAEMIEFLKERRLTRESLPDGPLVDIKEEQALEVLAVRLGGYVLDACGSDADLGPGRGPTAHATCRWLRKIEGVADGSRELPEPLRHALSSIFWRLVDTTRGTALGAVDDIEWLGPFAAWWALVIDRPAMLQQLATALPMIREGALESCCDLADALRIAVGADAPDGTWGREAEGWLDELRARDTELAQALSALAKCLGDFSSASGRSPQLEGLCLGLVLAAERLQASLADPVKALHPPSGLGEDSLTEATLANAPRVAALLTRAIKARELSMLDVWFTSLGPITSALVERAVRDAVGRTPPPPPSRRAVEPEVIEGYELVRPLGEGGVGKVYLVRKPGADRLFVLKIPKVEALAGANENERAGLLASFIEEANALAGIYHPNVANIIDRGVSNDVPFLVLELLIGADLNQYSAAKPLSLFELRQIVLDTCSGLSALHNAGLVHRDIKPANLWLRLPLGENEKFTGEKHRDPAHTRPLSAVVIDFGMVRPMRVAPDASGRFVAGTPGYIAPEQVLDPVELDGRADVYALAGAIYNVTTGRSFFDDVKNPRERIFSHMKRDPFEDASRLAGYPAELTKLMRAATALDPKDRPQPMEFGRLFEGCL